MNDLTPIRIRIKSSTHRDMTIEDAESGRPVTCESATLTMSADNIARLTVVILDFEVDVQRDVRRLA